ncbi:hypothetical protein [Aliarcobacter butzleri]|uniref:hypothetical protein n=1 Tax=Aliarcobacter butzleri TaxID=28197 RepID=UPI003AF5DC46
MAKLMNLSGDIVDIFNLKKEDITADVIILGACRINRFLGQTKYAYPVAAHLLSGYWYLEKIGASPTLKKQWLIHEAFESYSGVDLPSPLKAELPLYKEAEKKALKVIAEVFGVDPVESDEIKTLDRSIMIAEALVLMPNEEYWMNFSKEQNITPLCKTEVLQEYMCNENTLKHHLIKIWQNEFGIDTIKYPKFEITFFKKRSQDIYKKFEIEALTAEIAYEKIINEDEANSESPYKYEGFKNLEYSCKTIILNKDLVVNTKNYSIGIYPDENRGWFEHYKY